jgi:hypothetical protein
MTPKIKKQKKLLINQGQREQQPSFSRLEATATAEIPTTVNRKKLIFWILIDTV